MDGAFCLGNGNFGNIGPEVGVQLDGTWLSWREMFFFPASYRFMLRALGCFLEGRNPNKFPWHVWALVENESEMNIWSKSYSRCAENLRYTRYSEVSTIGCLNNSFETSGKVGAENHMSERESSQHHTFLITLVYFKDLLQLKNTSHKKKKAENVQRFQAINHHQPSKVKTNQPS